MSRDKQSKTYVKTVVVPIVGNPATCPTYYSQYPLEPNSFCIFNKLTTCVSNIIKYVMRYAGKNGVLDLYKAADYVFMLIESEYGTQAVKDYHKRKGNHS